MPEEATMSSQIGTGWPTVMMARYYQLEQLRQAEQSRRAARLRAPRPRHPDRWRRLLTGWSVRTRRTRPAVPKVS
jgi:hypothetical protein